MSLCAASTDIQSYQSSQTWSLKLRTRTTFLFSFKCNCRMFGSLLSIDHQSMYLLQHRAEEELKIFESVCASIPNRCPNASASETPAMLIAKARLLHTFAACPPISSHAGSFPFFQKELLQNLLTHKNQASISMTDLILMRFHTSCRE